MNIDAHSARQTITTVDELRTLPVGTVIRTADGTLAEIQRDNAKHTRLTRIDRKACATRFAREHLPVTIIETQTEQAQKGLQS